MLITPRPGRNDLRCVWIPGNHTVRTKAWGGCGWPGVGEGSSGVRGEVPWVNAGSWHHEMPCT